MTRWNRLPDPCLAALLLACAAALAAGCAHPVNANRAALSPVSSAHITSRSEPSVS